MRTLLVAAAVALLAAGCAAPTPTGAPVVMTPTIASEAAPETSMPGSTPSTPSPNPAASPGPSMMPFDAPYPDPGWAVAAAVDGTGSIGRVMVYGQVKAGALVDIAYACARRTGISVRVSDGMSSPGTAIFELDVTCEPGTTGRATMPSTATTTPLSLDAVADPAVAFWVKVAVPTDHLAR